MKAGDLLFWIWLAEALGADSPDLRRLMDLYDTPYDLFHAESAELEHIERLSARSVQSLSCKSLKRASAVLDACERMGIGVMPYPSELYPQLLREIRNPPAVLYYAGTVPDWNRRLCVGMVGTRKMSAYGMGTAYKISYDLACAGAVVVSGMAAGIDGVSAAAAMRAGGTTVAVLGCGLDRVYPRQHEELMKEISGKGLLLSEYPPGTKPVSYHFPVRNRIISGLSHGVVVVEAGLGSGSLITAKEAVMQGREVFAVPANADGIGAEGANGLLRDGAAFAENARDILRRYQYLFDSVLHPERIRESADRQGADLAYLQRMGVWNPTAGRVPESREKRAAAGVVPHDPAPARTEHPLSAADSSTGTSAQAKPRTVQTAAQSLSPVQAALLKAIPDDSPVTVEALCALGYPYGDVISALTLLEIAGLVHKLPGASYTKA